MGKLYDVFHKMLFLRIFMYIGHKHSVYLHIPRHITQKIIYIGIAGTVIIYGGLNIHPQVLFLDLSKHLIAEFCFLRKFHNYLISQLSKQFLNKFLIIVGKSATRYTVEEYLFALKLIFFLFHKTEYIDKCRPLHIAESTHPLRTLYYIER